MKLRDYRTIHPDLLPGLLNTALRNDFEDLDDLCAAHDIERAELESHLAGLGYRYREDIRQFRMEIAQG
jgi:hypothetical protein